MSKILQETRVFEIQKETKAPRPGVLRLLEGVFSVADSVSPDDNRNNRLYSDKLLKERIVESPYTKEMMQNGCLFGEADHPPDRLDIKITEVSHRIPELRYDNGKILGKVEILDTPSGRVVNTLCDVGATISISSRAAGDTITEGTKERVVEDSYLFYTFDLVLNPGMASARLANSSMAESVQAPDVKQGAWLKAINELIDKSDPSHLPVIESVLRNSSPDFFASSLQKIKEREHLPEPSSTMTMLEKAHRDLEEKKQEAATLSSQNATLQEKLSTLESLTNLAAMDLEKHQKDNASLIATLSESRRQVSLHKTQITRLEKKVSEASVLKDRIAEVRSERKAVTDENFSLSSQLTNLQLESSTKDSQLEALRSLLIEDLIKKTALPPEVVQRFLVEDFSDADYRRAEIALKALKTRPKSVGETIQKRTEIDKGSLSESNGSPEIRPGLVRLVGSVATNR